MLAVIAIAGFLVIPAASATSRAEAAFQDPAIRLTLDRDGAWTPGHWARVHVRASRDGYLVVLQADPRGTVRVLFPVDPIDDQFIPGQRDFEVRSRGDREAFQVESELGTGLVYAAWSADPFRLDEFRRGERWNLRALEIPSSELDLERGLTDLVTRMASAGGYDFDVLRYTVSESGYASVGGDGGYASGGGYSSGCDGCGGWDSNVYFSFGFGYGYPYFSFGYYPYYYPYYYGYHPYYPYYAHYPYYPYYNYGYPYYPYYKPWGNYPYARDRYGWKDPSNAVGTDRPGYRDRYGPTGYRDRGVTGASTLGTLADGNTTGYRRRLPSLGERDMANAASPNSGRRRTTTAAAAGTQSERPTAQSGGRRRGSGAEARPAQSGKPTTVSSGTGTRRRSELAANTPRSGSRQGAPTDARRRSDLPQDARRISRSQESPASPGVLRVRAGSEPRRSAGQSNRPELARRVERPGADRAPVTRNAAGRPRDATRDANLPSRVDRSGAGGETRGGRAAGGMPRRVEAPSGASSGRGGSPAPANRGAGSPGG
ncbi:MAG: DUF4384 domain-containing protein, partial [Gemmatimonadales bacterium]